MILVHRLHGDAVFLNADLIETVEAAPDTIVTLVDGRRIVVLEPPAEIIAAVTRFRASVIVAADDLRGSSRAALHVLPRAEG